MNIVITETEGDICSTVFSYEGCKNAEEVQREIEKVGADKEKVITFFQVPDDDGLTGLVSALCYYGNGLHGSFQNDLEKLLTEVFKAGQEYGRKRVIERAADVFVKLVTKTE